MSTDFRDDPEAYLRLASRRWRIRHSAWMLAVLFPLGFFTWAGFVYIGVRAKNRSWWIAGTVYGVVAWVAFLLPAEEHADGTSSNSIGAVTLLVVWVVGIVHAFRVRRPWLRWRAMNPGRSAAALAASYVEPASAGQHAAQPAQLSASPAPIVAALATAGPVVAVDVNTATAAQLATIPGFDERRVALVLGARYRVSGFSGFEQFVTAVGLTPQDLGPLRPWVTFSQPEPDGVPRRG